MHGALGARIRKAKTEKVPYVLVVGDDDVENDTVGVNARGNDDPERDVPVDDFVARLATEVANAALTTRRPQHDPRSPVGGVAVPLCERRGREAERRASCARSPTLPDDEVVSERTLVLERTATTLTVMNLYPYGSGHLLIAPRRHEAELGGLDEHEAQDLMAAERRVVRAIGDAYGSDGINLGVNLGRAGGRRGYPTISTSTCSRAGTATPTS